MALGGILTGMGTDPNAAPLVALLAFAMVPTLHAVPASSPGRVLVARHPVAGAATAAAALAVLVLSSTYPIASAAASSSTASHAASAQPAMAGMATAGASSRGSAHSKSTGLAMPGMGGRSDPDWHSTRALHSPPRRQSVLTTVFAETEKGHAMQTPSCGTQPTGSQMEDAMQLVQTTSSAVAKYKDLSAATADGYVRSPTPGTRSSTT
jgi:hypothetical protein